jgi:hypothetical protein
LTGNFSVIFKDFYFHTKGGEKLVTGKKVLLIVARCSASFTDDIPIRCITKATFNHEFHVDFSAFRFVMAKLHKQTCFEVRSVADSADSGYFDVFYILNWLSPLQHLHFSWQQGSCSSGNSLKDAKRRTKIAATVTRCSLSFTFLALVQKHKIP